ncbi:hypothetical protein NIASO_05730 [Niabella soli DSM 19437]|uniref:Uncharacterized protein n=1 Tax=Niabella soli DSM 19437 TaxID=929713 RepID=W0F2R4_9BACT|nr:hypothetical protein NIASO_05730 [Niabella soli DSM 19437]
MYYNFFTMTSKDQLYWGCHVQHARQFLAGK